MDVAAFCRQSRVLVVAGKGGVGKTTITAALARMAARAGLSVLVVELEGKPGVSAAFGQAGVPRLRRRLLAGFEEDRRHGREGPLGRGTVRARRITPDDALLEYLADHGMKRISKRLVSSGALDVVATAIPGIRDILVLGKVKQLEQQRVADLILVDAPATGHAMTFLSSAQGLLDAARSGPVRTQAADVVELLSDPGRCQVALVTLPEEMPVNEVVEAAYQLEDRVGICPRPGHRQRAACPSEPLLAEDPAAGRRRRSGWPRPTSQVAALSAAAGIPAAPRSGSRRSSGPAWPRSCPSPSSGRRSCSARRSAPRSSRPWQRRSAPASTPVGWLRARRAATPAPGRRRPGDARRPGHGG